MFSDLGETNDGGQRYREGGPRQIEGGSTRFVFLFSPFFLVIPLFVLSTNCLPFRQQTSG